MNETLNGTWSYLSFRHDPIVVQDDNVVGNPDLAKPWSSLGVLEVTTNDTRQVTGTLTFMKEVVLQISGQITPATDKFPAFVELTGVGPAPTSVNKLKGFFIPGSDHIVGTIMCVSNDLGKQPNGTAGPFVLFPIKE